MWQYISTYILSCSMAYISEKALNENKKRKFYFFSFLSIFFGAFLAGVRSLGIGTDIMTYSHYIFNSALSKDFISYFKIGIKTLEPLYLIFTYIVSLFTSNENIYYGIYHFFIIFFIYSGLLENRRISLKTGKNDTTIWLGLWVFYTLLYPFTLNGMRQSLAMSICFYSFKYIQKQDLKKFAILTVFAMGFHYTALINIVFYVINLMLEKHNKAIIKLSVSSLMFVLVFGYKYLLSFLVTFISRYNRYIGGNVHFMINPFLIRIPFLFMFICLKKYYDKFFSKEIDFWILMLVGEILFSQLRSAMPSLYRVSIYFSLIKMQSYPFIFNAFTKKDRTVINFFIIAFLLIIWYYQIVIQGNEEVYPYHSDIIKWLN